MSGQQFRISPVRARITGATVGTDLGLIGSLLPAIPLAAAFLFHFPPDRYAFYPRCPIHEYLHILCPGCGATRAFSALLHGHLMAALSLNLFAVLIVFPLAAVYAAICAKRLLRNQDLVYPAVPRSATIALIILAVAFTLVRNL